MVLGCPGEPPVRALARGPLAFSGNWCSGRVVTDAPERLEYELDDAAGALKPMYPERSVPVMRRELAQALKALKVTNVQYCDALLRDRDGVRDDYLAFNVIGTVAAVDGDRSRRVPTTLLGRTDVDFEALYLDEARLTGRLITRLAEHPSVIVVHRRVRDAIEALGFKGLRFYGPGEWSG